jgi:hypothetical protein
MKRYLAMALRGVMTLRVRKSPADTRTEHLK